MMPGPAPTRDAHADMTPPLRSQRHLFSIETGHVWLNNAYMGPIPRPAQQAAEEALRRRAFPVSITADDFFTPAERTRTLLAGLAGTDAERIAFVPTASYGLAIVARNLDPRPGANVVVLAEQFPSNVYPWRLWRDRGVALRTVAAPPGPWRAEPGRASRAARWNDAVLEAIDRDTLLVAIEQAHWTDGTLFDLAAIGRRCRDTGAAFVIDATQTCGAMPLEFDAIGADALVVHAYKSMLSQYGLGFVALGDRFAAGTPLEQSWLMREGSEDFSGLLDYRDDYPPGMRRYDTSLRANPVLIATLEASARLLTEWQPARVRAYLLELTRPFAQRVNALGYEVADEDDRAANLFGIRLPDGVRAEAVRLALAGRNIHVSVRGSAVRVSPHVYSEPADFIALGDALETLRASF